MDFHFIFKEVEGGAVTRFLFLQQETLTWMLLSQLPEPTFNLFKGVSSLRPFRIIFPNNIISSLSTKFLCYDPLQIIQRQFKLGFYYLTIRKNVFFCLVIFYNRLSGRNAASIFAGIRAKSSYKKKKLHSRYFNKKHGLLTTTTVESR